MMTEYVKHTKPAPIKVGIALVKNVMFWLVMACYLFPIYWLYTTSLKNRLDAFTMPPKWIFTPTFENFSKIFQTGGFMKTYANSLIIAVSTTLISLLVGIPMAYALARYKIPKKKNIMLWILSTKMAPPIMVTIPFYLIFRQLDMLDSYTSMIMLYLLFNLSFTVWMMKGFIEGIPYELEEAARIDGATRLYAFVNMILPLTIGGVVATSIICFINSWNEFFFAFILTGNTTKTAPVAVTSFISFEGIRWGEIAAAGVLVSVPIIIMSMMVKKYIVSGLTMGAIKS